MHNEKRFTDRTDSTENIVTYIEDDDDLPLYASGLKQNNAQERLKERSKLYLLVLLLLSLVLNAAVLSRAGAKALRKPDSDESCARRTSLFASPLDGVVNPDFHTTSFNGSFFRQTIYREDPSPPVDEAWDAIGTKDAWFPVPEELGWKYGLRKDYNALLATGEEKNFIATLEGLHHLHCVNMIRQTLFFNYNYYRDRKLGPFKNDDEIVKVHATHCIDILRQRLMCQPDLSVFDQTWVKFKDSDMKPFPFPDFNTQHKCMDYQSVLDWVEQRKLPEGQMLKLGKDGFTHDDMP